MVSKRFTALVGLVVMLGILLTGCLAPGDPGPGYSSTGTYPNPTGIYYHVQVADNALPYYWDVFNATSDIYNLTGIVIYVDPPGTPQTGAPGNFKVRMAVGVEAGRCGLYALACAQTELDPVHPDRIVGGTMLLVPGAIDSSAAGSIRHEFGHLMGLAHYLAGDTLMNPANNADEVFYDAGTILGLIYQRDQGLIAWRS